jgi:peptide deformylase
MPYSEVRLVPVDSIPSPPYDTPSDRIPLLYATAKSMEVLCRANNGLGIAASQVGLPWRMFIARSGWPSSDLFDVFFDCVYEPEGEESLSSIEGCLSLPGEHYRVERHAKVRVSGFRIVEGDDGASAEPFSMVADGLAAVLMQHEIDHDNGRERMIDAIGSRVVVA